MSGPARQPAHPSVGRNRTRESAPRRRVQRTARGFAWCLPRVAWVVLASCPAVARCSGGLAERLFLPRWRSCYAGNRSLSSSAGVGARNAWTRYDRSWDQVKKADVARKTSKGAARWRALEADERSLRAFDAHLALDGRVRMNPLLGTGGNAGKTRFCKGLEGGHPGDRKTAAKVESGWAQGGSWSFFFRRGMYVPRFLPGWIMVRRCQQDL